ncbi:MAG: hypothetical protein CO141_00545 [Candidatus Moranbacteria bacterium CG_4_9_14_3_um_filter_42_9]|nr:MAG: hypothetical protein CO141_00545 [Candidatus Moranbacteria bacterium CG_4_9_14_3_um_filter_42_9]
MAKMGNTNTRDVAHKHYNRLFKIMLDNDRKLIRKGASILSYRPRPYLHTQETIEEVLGEVENFLRKNLPGVKIPPWPKILR